jgi:hypothetical protein
MVDYSKALGEAIRSFWKTRSGQLTRQKKSGTKDQGSRGAVTGGRQLNGFINMLTKVSIRAGIPKNNIFVKGNTLPGFYRATKDWDFIIVSDSKKLIACIELKSQVGSFGNNFNNRTEEALGSALDLWTAFREGGFSKQHAPWLGYLILVEKSKKSTGTVKVSEPHFKVRQEFIKTNYLSRYEILCRKLMRERMYNATTFIWTTKQGSNIAYGCPKDEISFNSFIDSFSSHLVSSKREFEG